MPTGLPFSLKVSVHMLLRRYDIKKSAVCVANPCLLLNACLPPKSMSVADIVKYTVIVCRRSVILLKTSELSLGVGHTCAKYGPVLPHS